MTKSGNEARLERTTPGADPSAPPASVQPLIMPFEKGQILARKYRVESLIGTGGIGFVIAATHLELGERLALKFLRSEFATHPEAVRRFASEARHAARIRSEHVARVHDVGTLSDGSPFMVMELLDGTDLHHLLHREGPLAVDRVAGYVLEACQALAAAHACHIVHRDIKPDNLFLAKQSHGPDVVKVLDFGISKAELDRAIPGHGAEMSRRTIGALGSPSYMAPEQIRSAADVDGRADIWSLGCVLYELLTARHAFDAPSLMQVCAAVLEQEPEPPRRHREELPEALEAIILRCLEKDPSRRFQDVGELAVALAPFAPERYRASVDKTVETVANTRAYDADEPPPSSKVVRSRPTNDRPSFDDSAVRALPREIDAEWDRMAADGGPPSVRGESIATREQPEPEPPRSAGRLSAIAPPKVNIAKTRALEPAVPAAVRERAATPSTPEQWAVATRSVVVTSLDTPPRATISSESRVASIIIQEPSPPAPLVEPEPAAAVGPARSRVTPWLGLLLAALVAAAVSMTALGWRRPVTSATIAAPQKTTTHVVDTAAPVAPPELPAVVPDPTFAEAEPEVAAVPSNVRRPSFGAAPRARVAPYVARRAAPALQPADPSKIETVAEEVELPPGEGTTVDKAAAAVTATPQSSAAVPFGAIIPPAQASSARTASVPEPVSRAAPSAPAGAPVPASTVARVVREHAQEIQGCYDRAAMEHPDLHGRITLRAVVDGSGGVSQASASSIEDGTRLSACIAERARHWRFPAPPGGGPSPISYTLVFE